MFYSFHQTCTIFLEYFSRKSIKIKRKKNIHIIPAAFFIYFILKFNLVCFYCFEKNLLKIICSAKKKKKKKKTAKMKNYQTVLECCSKKKLHILQHKTLYNNSNVFLVFFLQFNKSLINGILLRHSQE